MHLQALPADCLKIDTRSPLAVCISGLESQSPRGFHELHDGVESQMNQWTGVEARRSIETSD